MKLGSDYCFDMGYTRPVEIVTNLIAEFQKIVLYFFFFFFRDILEEDGIDYADIQEFTDEGFDPDLLANCRRIYQQLKNSQRV